MFSINELWLAFRDSPIFMRRINGWLTVFWIVMIPLSVATGWIHSVTFVSMLSLWALVSGHWAVWQSARVEVKQKDMEGNVVAKIISETTLEKVSENEDQL